MVIWCMSPLWKDSLHLVNTFMTSHIYLFFYFWWEYLSSTLSEFQLENTVLGFPGGAVVENLPANAGDTGSSPGLGRSHMPRSNWACEPQLLSLRVWSLCPAAGGAVMVRDLRTAMKSGPRTTMKSGPRLPQLEKALARNEDPTQLKINK